MLNVAIQGAGSVSSEHIRAYKNNPHAQIVAISSRTLESAQKKSEAFALNCQCFDNFEQMLEQRDDIDIVSICTPPDLHAVETIAAAKTGKHLLIEKPLAVNQEELLAMDAAIKVTNVKTVVSFVLRWNPMVLAMKQAIQKGWIGNPLLIQADYWHGPTHEHPEPFSRPRWNPLSSGAIVHGGCHAMDAARFILDNAPIEQVSGISPTCTQHPNPNYRATTVATVQFAGGAIGKISGSTEFFMPYVFNLEVFGDEGVLRNNQLYTRQLLGQTAPTIIPTVLPDSGDVAHHPFQNMIDHLVECIQTQSESHNNLATAVNTHLACFAAEESAANGSQPIDLRPIHLH